MLIIEASCFLPWILYRCRSLTLLFTCWTWWGAMECFGTLPACLTWTQPFLLFGKVSQLVWLSLCAVSSNSYDTQCLGALCLTGTALHSEMADFDTSSVWIKFFEVVGGGRGPSSGVKRSGISVPGLCKHGIHLPPGISHVYTNIEGALSAGGCLFAARSMFSVPAPPSLSSASAGDRLIFFQYFHPEVPWVEIKRAPPPEQRIIQTQMRGG